MEGRPIIQLTEPISLYEGVKDSLAVKEARIVISDDGVVVMDRGGVVPRRPSLAETEAAVTVSPRELKRRKTDK